MSKVVRRTLEQVKRHKISSTRLAKIAAIADSEIDTSDIPEVPRDLLNRGKGHPLYRPVKQQVTVRIDADVLRWLKSREAKGYQSRLNEVLRRAMVQELLKKSA